MVMILSLLHGEVSILAGHHVGGLPDLHLRQPWGPVLVQRDPPGRRVQVLPGDHLDALDDGADGVAEGAAGAGVVLHLEKKFDCVTKVLYNTKRCVIPQMEF